MPRQSLAYRIDGRTGLEFTAVKLPFSREDSRSAVNQSNGSTVERDVTGGISQRPPEGHNAFDPFAASHLMFRLIIPMSQKRIFCESCGAGQVCGPLEAADLLRSRGMLRRESEPDDAMVAHLLENSLPQLRCPSCDGQGLVEDKTFQPHQDGWDDWGEVKKACEICKQDIPPERLEIFPDETRCAACKDAPEPTDEADYCTRCGSILTIRSASQGLTKYKSYCPSCRR